MKRIFSIVFALVLAVSLMLVPAASVGASPGPGLVGLWHFDEGTGPTAYDSSGNANNGTITGAIWEIPGKFGNALSFDGTDDYVNCGAAVDDTIATGVTLEAWIKPAAKQRGGIISNDLTLGTKKGYDFFLWDTYGIHGSLFIDYGDGTSVGRTYWSIPSADWYNQWHHVAATWDGSTVRLYADGSEVGTASLSGTYSDPGKDTLIGGINYLTPPYSPFNGTIDEVRIWDSAHPTYTLEVSPEVDFNPAVVDTEHAITASITPAVPGVEVKFDIIGPNSAESGTADTDSSGVATFTYTSNGDAGEDTILVWIDQDWSGGDQPNGEDVSNDVTKYWLENFVTGGGKINVSGGKKTAWTFGGTVGVLEDIGIVGQFQIVDHVNKVAYHLNSFTDLSFTGPSAESPVASHNTANFTGSGTGNDGSSITVNVVIQDLGEPGAGVDTINVSGNLVFGGTIDGGNFQVHDYE